MLYHSVRSLCIALSVQSLVFGVVSRPFDEKNRGCTAAVCGSKDLDVEAKIGTFNNTIEPLWVDVHYRVPSVVETLRRTRAPRANPIPITVPKPVPKPADEPDESLPRAKPDGTPATDPTGADPEEEADVIVKTCTPGSDGVSRRSECHPDTSGDDTGDQVDFGENPAVDPPVPAGGVAAAPAQPKDFFELVKAGNAGPNDARDALEARIRDNTPDVTVPDIEAFDKVYQLAQADMKDITISQGRQQVNILLQKAGVSYDAAGSHFTVEDRVRVDPFQFHESTWSNDGIVGFADFSVRSLDETAAELRLPWFQVMMHIRTQRLPNAPPVQQMPTLAIGRVIICNVDTIKTMNSIFEALNPTNADDLLVLNANAAAGSDEAFAFDAFSRTDNGRGVFWLAANNHQALGDKVVTQIVLQQALNERKPSALLVISNPT